MCMRKGNGLGDEGGGNSLITLGFHVPPIKIELNYYPSYARSIFSHLGNFDF